MADKKLFCPFIKSDCKKEGCALYLKDIEQSKPDGIELYDVKMLTTGCAITILATRRFTD